MYVPFIHPNNFNIFNQSAHRKTPESQCRPIRGILAGFKITVVGFLLLSGGCITVDSTVDSIDINPGDGTCEDSANRCTLRAAVMEAEASAGKYTIMVPAGLYSLNLPPASGGGSLKINKGMRIRGDGSDSTIIEQVENDLAIYITGGDAVELDHLAVQGGDSVQGGGIRINAGTVELEDLNIRDNFAFTGGGGLYVLDGAEVRMYRSTISNNNAEGAFGGGIWNKGELWVYDSTINNNDANSAGGIRNEGDLNLRNVTVSGNTTHSPSAAVGGISQNGFAVLNNVTVTNNAGRGNQIGVSRGGGIQILPGQTTVMINSIVAGNFGNGGPDDCVGQLSVDSQYNLIGDTTDCIITSNISTYQLDVTADLEPLAYNSGVTQTHRTQTSSIARDNGYGFPPPAINACEARDQRGVPRPQGSGGCDLGAYEYTQSSRLATGIMLVDAATDTDIRLLRNDDFLILGTLPDELSLRAVITGGNPGSVEFGYDADSSFNIENVAPYSLAGDSSGDFAAATLTPGAHTVIATPFVGPDATGQAGGAITINFTVIDN